MKKSNVQITLLQETKVKDQTEERDEEYVTYFSSNPQEHKTINKGNRGRNKYRTRMSGNNIKQRPKRQASERITNIIKADANDAKPKTKDKVH